MKVEWSEINAAWGQCTLLLYTLARKLDFAFETYVLLFHCTTPASNKQPL